MTAPLTDVACVEARLSLLSESLTAILLDFVERGLPARRVAKLAGLLHLSKSGCPDHLFDQALQYVARFRHGDGGWVDTEDSLWATYLVGELCGKGSDYLQSVDWLASQRSGPAWGYCPRDLPSIPATSLVRSLVPELSDQASGAWLAEAWEKDLGGPRKLSYKAAWFLLACREDTKCRALVRQTVEHLVADQRADGGWGPWRSHPAPTDCFATGIALKALAEQGADDLRPVLDKAVNWALSARLAGGLYPTHFIEEGSAWVLLGLSAVRHGLGLSRGQ